jgi:hypothetical protein
VGGDRLPNGAMGSTVRSLFWAGLLVTFALLTAVPSSAQRLTTVPRPIRLEGYWDRTRAERDVIGEVTISAEGHPSRRFGVTAVQAYQPEEEGIQIFRFTSDHPATLVARGDGVGRLFAAPRDRKIVVFATYTAGSGLFVVGSVDVEQHAPPAGEPRR